MTMIFTANDSTSASVIADQLHDAWFSASDLVPEGGQIRLPIYKRNPLGRVQRWRRDQEQPVQVLTIFGVMSCSTEDEADIEWYDIAALVVDEGAVVIKSGMPFTATIVVARLHMSLAPWPAASTKD